MAQQAPFPVDQVRTALAIAYRNTDYIADFVLPRVTAPAREFKYLNYPVAETFMLPDTKVGRKSKPNEITLTASDATGSVEDFGLDDMIPQQDIDNAPEGYDPLARSTEQLTDYILLDREKRVADLVFAAGTYPAGYKVQLAGNDQWSADHADSDPITDINLALETPLVRPNTLVLGSATWTSLRVHPQIVAAVNRNSGEKGIATREDVARLFEVKNLWVGQSRLNTAKKGQAAVLARVWGKHAAALYIDPNADLRSGLSFGMTAQHGTRVSGAMANSNIGLRGGQQNRVGESVKELVTASMAGYFIQDAVG